MIAYFMAIVGSLVVQGLAYYDFGWKYSKDFAIGVIILAYILAFIFNLMGGEYLGLHYFMTVVMFAILPSYAVVSLLSSLGQKIDDSIK